MRSTRAMAGCSATRIFRDYFNRQDWYVAQTASAKFDESVLNEVEQYNVELIHSYEMQQGY